MGGDPIPGPLDALSEWFEAGLIIQGAGMPSRLVHGTLAERILEAIPYEEWVTASEVAAETGISSHVVDTLISQRLLNVHVE